MLFAAPAGKIFTVMAPVGFSSDFSLQPIKMQIESTKNNGSCKNFIERIKFGYKSTIYAQLVKF